MGKYAKYKKHYRKEWEQMPVFKGWLQQHNDIAYCKICKVSLRPQKSDLEKHSKTLTHKKNKNKIDPDKLQTRIESVVVVKDETKEIEMKIAQFVGTHCSLRSVDHLSDLIEHIVANDRKQAPVTLRLHRTKCIMLIKNVIATCFLEELLRDVENSHYSLIIDESTDVSVNKYLCLCIRYFSKSTQKIVTDYLGLIQIEEATAEVLSNHIKDFLNKLGLKLENLLGLGTDGASNLCGKNNSVFTRLKENCPDLQLIKCIAHSLHLCCSKAADMLPASIDFLCKEIYNFFSKSTLRQAGYKQFFSMVNINEQKSFHKLIQLSDTRWLVRANVIKIIKDQWIELKGYFDVFVTHEKNYMAHILKDMLHDNQNYIYLSIIYPVLMSINVVNALFQQENADIFRVYSELYTLLMEHLRVFIKPIFLRGLQDMTAKNFKTIIDILNNELTYMPIDLLDFGYNYRQALGDFPIDNQTLSNIKYCGKTFYRKLCLEICNRIPENINLLNSIKWFSIDKCLYAFDRPKIDVLPLNFLKDVDYSVIEHQWECLILVDWKTEGETTESFWVQVLNHKNAGGQFIFKELATLALKICTLPLSNAVVERIFSVLNFTKSKVRNRMNISLIDALIRLKITILKKDICCKKFNPPKRMFELFNQTMYDNKKKNREENNEIINEETFDTIHEFLPGNNCDINMQCY